MLHRLMQHETFALMNLCSRLGKIWQGNKTSSLSSHDVSLQNQRRQYMFSRVVQFPLENQVYLCWMTCSSTCLCSTNNPARIVQYLLGTKPFEYIEKSARTSGCLRKHARSDELKIFRRQIRQILNHEGPDEEKASKARTVQSPKPPKRGRHKAKRLQRMDCTNQNNLKSKSGMNIGKL